MCQTYLLQEEQISQMTDINSTTQEHILAKQEKEQRRIIHSDFNSVPCCNVRICKQ